MVAHAASQLLDMAKVLKDYEFTQRIGIAAVVMQPIGAAGMITPWNSDADFICGKLAAAIAASCTVVIKPSEMSAMQTRVVTLALHEAGLPAGVFNIVTGRGDAVGAEILASPDVAKISFTGGRSPVLALNDADFEVTVPLTLQARFMNSGQTRIAGVRNDMRIARGDLRAGVIDHCVSRRGRSNRGRQ